MPTLRRRDARRGGRLELPRRVAFCENDDVSLHSHVNFEAFVRALGDPELRPLLGLNLTQGAAEAILASRELTQDYYARWKSQRGGTEAASVSIARFSARLDPKPDNAITVSAPQRLSIRAAVHSLIWPSASIVVALLAGVLAVAIWTSDLPYYERDAAFIWLGIGYFLALIACVVGIVWGSKAIRAGLKADLGVARRRVSVTLGLIGLLGSAFLALSWIVGWATMR